MVAEGGIMKIGDVIKHESRWGVISRIRGSYAQCRIEAMMATGWNSYVYCPEHVCVDVDLVDYYKWVRPSFWKRRYYSIHRLCEDVWWMVTYDIESILMTCMVMTCIAFIIAFIYTILCATNFFV